MKRNAWLHVCCSYITNSLYGTWKRKTIYNIARKFVQNNNIFLRRLVHPFSSFCTCYQMFGPLIVLMLGLTIFHDVIIDLSHKGIVIYSILRVKQKATQRVKSLSYSIQLCIYFVYCFRLNSHTMGVCNEIRECCMFLSGIPERLPFVSGSVIEKSFRKSVSSVLVPLNVTFWA